MTCDILLSICGEAEFLKPQLDSVAKQKGDGIRLLYRFDGEPSPQTLKLLADFPNAEEIPWRDHLGVVKSYRRLIEASTADYFALADQDDVWSDDKIASLIAEMKSLEALHGAGAPLAVHSNMRVVDRDGKVIASSFVGYQSLCPSRCRLRDLLVQNNVTGCAMMGNRALREMAKEIPNDAICHDWYLALVAAAFGHIGFVRRPLVDYRQHGKNAIGAVRRLKVLRRRDLCRAMLHLRIVATQRQAAAFLGQFGDRLSDARWREVSVWAGMEADGSHFSRLWKMLRFGFRKNDLLRTLGMLWAI